MKQVFMNRTRSSDSGTFGELRADTQDSEILCVTVELPWLNNHRDTSCIPIGTYVFKDYYSPRHGEVWMAEDVPGRLLIQIHAANWPADLRGCIGVGEQYVEDLEGAPGVTHSQHTLQKLRSILPPIIQVRITEDLSHA